MRQMRHEITKLCKCLIWPRQFYCYMFLLTNQSLGIYDIIRANDTLSEGNIQMLKDDEIKKLLIPVEGIYDVCQPLDEYVGHITAMMLATINILPEIYGDGFEDEVNAVKKHFKNDDYDYDVVSGLILGLALAYVNTYLVMNKKIEMDNTRIIEDFIISLPISASAKAAALKNLIYAYYCDRRMLFALNKNERDDAALIIDRKFGFVIDVLISGKSYIKYGNNKTLKLDTLKHGNKVLLESDLISRIGFVEHPLITMFASKICIDNGYDYNASDTFLKSIGDFVLNNPNAR